MSYVWNFSPSSEPLLRQCIEAALLQETENQWTQKFGSKTETLECNSDIPEAKTPALTVEKVVSPEEQHKNEDTVSYEDFFDSLQHEVRLSFVIEECNKNPNLFVKIAQTLPVNTVEKLFNLTFAAKDVEKSFLLGLLLKFLPDYIKLQNSCVCIDILTKTNENFPEIFQKLVKILLEDIEIPDQVLNSFVSTLDQNKLSIFMENLTNHELSSEIFIHNISMINAAYKSCIKTERIQNWIQANLIQHSNTCVSDRNFGRLFLAYLQAEKLLGHTVSKKLADCLEVHHSPFKRPCSYIVKELLQN